MDEDFRVLKEDEATNDVSCFCRGGHECEDGEYCLAKSVVSRDGTKYYVRRVSGRLAPYEEGPPSRRQRLTGSTGEFREVSLECFENYLEYLRTNNELYRRFAERA